MKSLHLTKPVIITLVGLPGSGKSFFARHFSEAFDTPLVSVERLYATVTNNADVYSPEHAIIAKQASLVMAEELARTKKSFVIDGGMSRKLDRTHLLREIAKRHGYDTLTVWVQTDKPTCQQRATARNRRRTDDRYQPSLSDTEFADASKKLAKPTKTEHHVVISGKHTFHTQAKTVLRTLVGSRAHQATQAHRQQVREQLPDRPLPKRNVVIR